MSDETEPTIRRTPLELSPAARGYLQKMAQLILRMDMDSSQLSFEDVEQRLVVALEPTIAQVHCSDECDLRTLITLGDYDGQHPVKLQLLCNDNGEACARTHRRATWALTHRLRHSRFSAKRED